MFSSGTVIHCIYSCQRRNWRMFLIFFLFKSGLCHLSLIFTNLKISHAFSHGVPLISMSLTTHLGFPSKLGYLVTNMMKIGDWNVWLHPLTVSHQSLINHMHLQTRNLYIYIFRTGSIPHYFVWIFWIIDHTHILQLKEIKIYSMVCWVNKWCELIMVHKRIILFAATLWCPTSKLEATKIEKKDQIWLAVFEQAAPACK